MCGRLALPDDWSDLRLRLEVQVDEIPKGEDDEASSNVAPTEASPIVIEKDGVRIARLSTFGFASSQLGKHIINARSETITEKKMFSRALRTQRCLVVADGFYEWMGPARARVPYFVALPGGEPFTFAGLYRTEPKPDGSVVTSHVIVTAEAGDVMRALSDREPVILSPDARDVWLAGGEPEDALESALATRIRDLVHWEVGTAVNRPGPRGRELREPAKPKTPAQGSLF